MSKSKIFVGICLAFSLGIFIASRFFVDLRYIYGSAGIAIIFFILGLSKNYKKVCLAGVFLLFTALGILRFYQAAEPNGFSEFFDRKVEWEGYVVEDPDVRLDKQLITVRPKEFSQRILITTTKTQKFFYGDWVLIQGKIKAAKDFEDFDYTGYLERFGVYALIQYPKVIILKNDQGSLVKSALLKIKHAFAGRVSQYLKEPQNSLALGIIIGARRGLPQEAVDNFNLTGTSHIVAMSGFNITIIITALSYLAWIIGRRANFWLSLILILGFTIIAGASASVIRASVMGVLLLIAFNSSRMYSAVPAMLFAGAAMLFFNPKILFWDVGFQLSFAATLGLIFFMPLFENLTKNWPKVFGLKNIFLGTLAAVVSTLPLILWYFGRLSLVALLANVLVLPVVPAAMLFGFLISLPFLAPGFALMANLLLAYILWVTAKLAELPFASVEVEISAWALLLMLALLIYLYFVLRQVVRQKSIKVGQPAKLW